MSSLNEQLEKNRQSRKNKNKWLTENNNRNNYQAFRDTILNYLYYKKKHSSGKPKTMYKYLFVLLRNNPEKKAAIYADILNDIDNIHSNPNSYTYQDFLETLDKLYYKYENKNFTTELAHLVTKQRTRKLIKKNIKNIQNIQNIQKQTPNNNNEAKLNELNEFMKNLSNNESSK